MPESIDDLARRWKSQPDATGAIRLCEALRKSPPGTRAPHVDEVGKLAVDRFGGDGSVLLAVARLYASVDRLSDAQSALISAGRIASKDPDVFRLLGEVLLRRGDAERAEKVLLRAKQLGANDPETAMWIDRAKVFKPVQAKAGTRAVAIEVKNTAIHPVTPHPDVLQPPRLRADSVDPDQVTSVRNAPIHWPKDDVASRGGLSMETETNVQRGVLDFPRDIPLDAPLALPGGAPVDPLRRPAVPFTGPMSPQDLSRSDALTLPRGPAPAVAAPPAVAASGTLVSSEAYAAPAYSPALDPYAAPAALPALAKEEPPPASRAPRVRENASAAERNGRAATPSAREVLEALTNAGVFEPREATSAQIVWDRPNEKTRRRTAVGLSIGIVVFLLGAGGTYFEVQRRRAIAHDEAEATLAKVEADLDASKTSLLPQIEQTIGHAFELDSRSPRAAVDWLAERTMKGLLQGGAELAFEDAMGRATEVKVPEDKIAFARVSAFLFQGDTGGAAGVMPKWDGPAASQPLYQLVTGATLDHAGDPHAAERFQAATKLAPNLVIAQILLTRATAIDGDPSKAADLAKQFRAKYPDRPEGAALVALAWARDPGRGEQAPPDVAEAIAHAGELPVPLLAIPHALAALTALDKHQIPEAKAEIELGLKVADDPGVATWLGSLALDTHDEALVRKAALLAVTFSAVYAPARVLAARIALLGGRLDEALKATEDLDPTSGDVAIVRAAVAYERSDADAMGRALEAVPAETKKLPAFTALVVAPDVLLGREDEAVPHTDAAAKLTLLSTDEAPWSDLVAMDAALDLGLTDVADKIAESWKGTEDKPLKALRLSRLARYENRLADADRYSKSAVDTGTVTPRLLIERVLVLVALNHYAEVGPLLARYPLVLGSSSSWLSAYSLASTGKVDEARGRTAQLDVPPTLSPLAFRVMAAVSLAAMKDKKRAEPAVRALLAAGIADPDLLAAAASVGLKAAGPAPKPAGKARGKK